MREQAAKEEELEGICPSPVGKTSQIQSMKQA
jgi:hypothetical protein